MVVNPNDPSKDIYRIRIYFRPVSDVELFKSYTIDQGYIDVQLGAFRVLRLCLGYVIVTRVSGKYKCMI